VNGGKSYPLHAMRREGSDSVRVLYAKCGVPTCIGGYRLSYSSTGSSVPLNRARVCAVFISHILHRTMASAFPLCGFRRQVLNS